MSNLVNFKFILNSAFYPAMPLFSGAIGARSTTKWRGAAAEFTYNPYLRNGWVVIDTGIKGNSGTPIIEFSTWQATKSKTSIVLPNVISYKFFFANKGWRAGYLARSAVEARENWSLGGIIAPPVLNSYAAWRIQRAVRYSGYIFSSIYAVSSKYAFIFAPALISSLSAVLMGAPDYSTAFGVRLQLKFKKILQNTRREAARFSVFDRNYLITFYSIYRTPAILTVTDFLVRRLRSKLFSSLHLSRNSSANFTLASRNFADTLPDISFFSALFQFNSLILFYGFFLDSVAFTKILNNLISNSLRRLLLIVLYGLNPSSNYASSTINLLFDFVRTRVSYFFATSKLNFRNLSQLVVFFLVDYSSSVTKLQNLNRPVNNSFIFNKISYKFRRLSLNSLFLGKAESQINPSNSLRNLESNSNFFANYIKIRAKRSKTTFKYSGRRRKYGFKFRKKTKVLLVSGAKYYHRSWSRLVSFFKLFFLRKQFFFISFWTFNFFNLTLVSNKGKFKRIFLRTVRLLHFFKKFFNFFQFYTFYFNLMGAVISSSGEGSSTKNTYTYCLNNLGLFMWALHLKFWRVLRTFHSLCKKFFFLRWKRIAGSVLKIWHFAGDLPRFQQTNSLSFPSNLSVRDAALPLFKKTSAKLISSVLLNSYLSFINAKRFAGAANRPIFFTRTYLDFLLRLRKKAVSSACKVNFMLFSGQVESSNVKSICEYFTRQFSSVCKSLTFVPVSFKSAIVASLVALTGAIVGVASRIDSRSTTNFFAFFQNFFNFLKIIRKVGLLGMTRTYKLKINLCFKKILIGIRALIGLKIVNPFFTKKLLSPLLFIVALRKTALRSCFFKPLRVSFSNKRSFAPLALNESTNHPYSRSITNVDWKFAFNNKALTYLQLKRKLLLLKNALRLNTNTLNLNKPVSLRTASTFFSNLLYESGLVYRLLTKPTLAYSSAVISPAQVSGLGRGYASANPAILAIMPSNFNAGLPFLTSGHRDSYVTFSNLAAFSAPNLFPALLATYRVNSFFCTAPTFSFFFIPLYFSFLFFR